MHVLRSAILAAAFVVPLTAHGATFYLHHSVGGVSVPGGTTNFYLDQTAPTSGTVTAASLSVPMKTSATFPTFIAPTFGAPATVDVDFLATLHLSANLSMNGCALLTVTLGHVSTTGLVTGVTSAAVGGLTVPQGSMGGTAGFAPLAVPFTPGCSGTFEDIIAVGVGESIAVTVTVTNLCNANRTVSLAYDGTAAPGSVDVVPLPPTFLPGCRAKCAAAQIKCANGEATGLLGCEGKAEGKGVPVDPFCVFKVLDKFTGGPDPTKGCMEKAEGNFVPSLCANSGSDFRTTIEAKVAGFVGSIVSQVGLPPPAIDRCGAGKKKCVANKVKALLLCYNKAAGKNLPVDPLCLQKASDKFTGGVVPTKGCFAKLEMKYPNTSATPCKTVGDVIAVEPQVDAFALDVFTEITMPPPTGP
jgi:hypothetical protein